MTRSACRLATLALLVALAAPSAVAQVSFGGIAGRHWMQAMRPSNSLVAGGASYDLNEDGTYLYTSGRTTGMLTHSGQWSLENRGRTLMLRADARTERRNGRIQHLRSTRTLRVPIRPTGGTSIEVDGVRFSG